VPVATKRSKDWDRLTLSQGEWQYFDT